jgi:hypothetical protein
MLLTFPYCDFSKGGVSNVDIDGNNTLEIKGIGVTISTFETLPQQAFMYISGLYPMKALYTQSLTDMHPAL